MKVRAFILGTEVLVEDRVIFLLAFLRESLLRRIGRMDRHNGLADQQLYRHKSVVHSVDSDDLLYPLFSYHDTYASVSRAVSRPEELELFAPPVDVSCSFTPPPSLLYTADVDLPPFQCLCYFICSSSQCSYIYCS